MKKTGQTTLQGTARNACEPLHGQIRLYNVKSGEAGELQIPIPKQNLYNLTE